MSALTFLDALEAPLKPVLDPRIYVEPKDRDPASEEQRQAKFVNMMRRDHKACRTYAVPNGQDRTQWERNKVMREGLAIGEPDVGVTWADAPTARIEFKNGSRMPDDSQVETLNWYCQRGHPVAVCRTADGALRWLRSVGAPV